jgi:hypothetical protein
MAPPVFVRPCQVRSVLESSLDEDLRSVTWLLSRSTHLNLAVVMEYSPTTRNPGSFYDGISRWFETTTGTGRWEDLSGGSNLDVVIYIHSSNIVSGLWVSLLIRSLHLT